MKNKGFKYIRICYYLQKTNIYNRWVIVDYTDENGHKKSIKAEKRLSKNIQPLF